MSQFQFDLFVIGAGSAGVRAARMSAQYGARVAIAEDRYMGGTCVNVGCVPKKLFMYAAHFEELFRDATGFGWGWTSGHRQFNWQQLIKNKDNEINRLNGIYENLLKSSGARIYEAHASLVDANTIEVGGEIVSARNILIATGGWPWVPEFAGSEYAITSNEIFHLKQLPARAVVVGGGYIAVEFASILNGLGVKANLVYRGDLFLRGFDHELRQNLAEEMTKKGITLSFNSEVTKITRNSNELSVHIKDKDTIECDLVLYATGRRPRTQGLGLSAAGVKCDDNGYVVVDEYFKTSAAPIYAIGDVIGGAELTPMALAQGMAVAKTLFGGKPSRVDTQLIPTAAFSQPSLASVGLSEEEARKRGEITVFTAKFTQLKHTLAGNSEKTFIKLVVDKATDRVLGAHMLGPDAAEIIQGLAVAMQAGATKAHFDATLGIHPTAAEEFVTMRTAR